nr:hypothetical protein [Tanacetum cinerariifolium]
VLGDDVQDQSIPSPTPPTLPPQLTQDIPSTSQVESYPPQPQSLTPAQPQGADFLMSVLQEALDACAALTRRVEHLEHDKVAQDLEITKLKTRVKKLERANKVKTLKLRRLRKVGTSQRIDAASANIAAVFAAIITAAPVRVAAASTRRRKGVVIRDLEKKSTIQTLTETKSKDKGKGIMVEEPNPMKKKQQDKEDPYVQRYQVMKKRLQTEAQAQRNMIMSLKNTARFRLDYFKRMSYDDIRLIFEAKFNLNIEFLLKSKEQIKEEENRALESINETPAQKAAKKKEVE